MASIPLKYVTGSLQEQSQTELLWYAHQILLNFAASNTGTGTIAINGTGTNIGGFSDTARTLGVGDHPTGTTTLTTNFTQDLTAYPESFERPIEYTADSISSASDSILHLTITDLAAQVLTSGGLGSYVLQPTAPADGATWSNLGSITDTRVTNSNVATTTLWRKVTEPNPPAEPEHPLKITDSGGTLQEMTNTEMRSLCHRFRNRIVSTGVGQYRVSPTAPGVGTWVRVGNAFDDTRQQAINISYTTNFSNTFAGDYPVYYAGVYYGIFTFYFTGYFTGFFTGLTTQAATEVANSYSLWVRTA